MKRIITVIMALVFAFSTVISLAPAAFAEDSSNAPRTGYSEAIAEKAKDDMYFAGFCGRLSIPGVGINVAMYSSLAQSVCDREDSACCFNLSPYSGYLIADHSNQDFWVLPSVTVGTVGGICQPNGDITYIMCMESYTGHNTGSMITDNNYNVVAGQYDYLMYTCLDGWTNVQVCQWSIIGSYVAETGTFYGLDGIGSDILYAVMY